MGHQFTDGKMAAAQRSLSSCRNKQISLGAEGLQNMTAADWSLSVSVLFYLGRVSFIYTAVYPDLPLDSAASPASLWQHLCSTKGRFQVSTVF